MTTTGNMGLDALADAIAERVIARMNDGKAAKRLMTVKEAAAYMALSDRALWHLISSAQIAVVRNGRSVRLETSMVDAWIDLRNSRG
jgi:excisionase family DNA binding protein